MLRHVAAVGQRGKMWDVLGDRMLGADSTSIYAVALASLRHGIVTRIEILALFQVLGKVVGASRELAIEAEESLLLGGERLLPKCLWSAIGLV